MDHNWDQYSTYPAEHSGWHCKNCGAFISVRATAIRPAPGTKVGGTQIYDSKLEWSDDQLLAGLTCDEVQVYRVMRS